MTSEEPLPAGFPERRRFQYAWRDAALSYQEILTHFGYETRDSAILLSQPYHAKWYPIRSDNSFAVTKIRSRHSMSSIFETLYEGINNISSSALPLELLYMIQDHYIHDLCDVFNDPRSESAPQQTSLVGLEKAQLLRLENGPVLDITVFVVSLLGNRDTSGRFPVTKWFREQPACCYKARDLIEFITKGYANSPGSPFYQLSKEIDVDDSNTYSPEEARYLRAMEGLEKVSVYEQF